MLSARRASRLTHVECRSYRIAAIWTDAPGVFLDTICSHYRSCTATLALGRPVSRIAPLGEPKCSRAGQALRLSRESLLHAAAEEHNSNQQSKGGKR